jgi:hypothetical protein
MESQPTYTREYLQSLYEHAKNDKIDMIVNTFIRPLLFDAQRGMTSYCVYHIATRSSFKYDVVLSQHEIIQGLQQRFPDCIVQFQNDSHQHVVIDWS